MPDRPNDSDRGDYDWLFGGPTERDDEATQRIPVSGRPEAYQRGIGSDPEPTQILPAGPERGRSTDPWRDRPSAPSGRPPETVPPRPASRPPAPRRRRRRWGRIVLIVVALWLVLLIAVPIWAWSQIEQVDAEPGGNRPEATPGSTYLLVGSDSRDGLDRQQRRDFSTGDAVGQRTDTILLLHEPRFTGPTLLLSLPRDSIVDIPRSGTDKLNAAFAFGGPRLLVRTVEQETGVRIDNYVEIGFGGFVDVVDAVGGIEICPRRRMRDPQAGLDIARGCQEADGATALGYVRSRKVIGTGDIDRGRRQREVVGKVAGKAASVWTVLNPIRYVRTANAGADALRIGENVGPIDLARFAWAMRSVTGDNGLTCTVPIVDFAVTWDEERAEDLFELIRQDNTEDIGRDLCTRTGLPR